MNGATLKELKIVVEHVVRPIRAAVARKRRMREELLAHLTAIFEEEAERLGDEPAALRAARERFGDARELSAQIQATVPRWERVSVFLDGLFLYRQGESVLAHAARVAVQVFWMFGVNLVVVPFGLFSRGRAQEVVPMEFFFLGECVVFAGVFFVMTLLGHGLRETLFRGVAARSVPLAIVCGLLSALMVPLGGFALVWLPTGDVGLACAHARSLWWLAALVPVIMMAALWQIAADARKDEPWTSLRIDQ